MQKSFSCELVVGRHFIGFVMRSHCIAGWRDKKVEKLCQETSQSNFLHSLPVFDHIKNLTYRNIYCALCNAAANYSYWKVGFNFHLSKGEQFQLPSTIQEAMRRNDLSLVYTPPKESLEYMKHCASAGETCKYNELSSNDML